jgi:membrane-associated phospholipid phosphatase
LDTFGQVTQEYHTGNSTAFRNAAFTKELINNHQQVTWFMGVGAHHSSNGIAEQAIHTIMGMARTMMLHAAIRWPDMSDAQLWPLAVQYANRMLTMHNGLSPLDLLSRMKQTLDSLNDMHVFGCPVYVLDPLSRTARKFPSGHPNLVAVFLWAYLPVILWSHPLF